MLSDECLAETDSAEELHSVLMGEQQPAAFLFDSSTLLLDIADGDLMTLKALNAGLLQRHGAVEPRFVSDVIVSPPLHLGQSVCWTIARRATLSAPPPLAVRQPPSSRMTCRS